MFRLEALEYSYPGGGRALRGFSADIPAGVTVLAGPNAGGKTTVLKLLAGLLPPRGGAVRDRESGEPLSTADLRRLGRMVLQDPEAQLLGAAVGEDLMLGLASSSLPPEAFRERAGRLAEKFGLADRWDESVDSLSHGGKRKLCLAHALLAGPRVLLLDEPFSGLDYPSIRELRECIRENRRAGLTQVISSHELEPVFDLADWMVVAADGLAVAEGVPEELHGRIGEWAVRPPGGGWD